MTSRKSPPSRDRRLFPERVDRIPWLAVCGDDGTDPFTRHCGSRQERDTAKLKARMHEWAQHGDWNNRVGYLKRLDLPTALAKKGVPIYEVKSHQDRILFIRDGNSAVVVYAMVKKDDWSKKDARVLEAAVEAAVRYQQQGRQR